MAAVVVYQAVIKNMLAYQKAEQLAQQSEYEEAAAAFEALGDYKDSAEQAKSVKYAWAQEKEADGDYSEAVKLYQELGSYQDSSERAVQAEKNEEKQNDYEYALELLNYAKDFEPAEVYDTLSEAREAFLSLGDFKDAAEYAKHFVWRLTHSQQDWMLGYCEYDDNGDLAQCGYSDHSRYHWSADHLTLREEGGRNGVWEYDKQGDLVRYASDDGTRTYTYDFNENGSIAHRYEKYVDGSYTADAITEYEYDEEGRIIQTVEEYTSDYDRNYGKVPGRVTTGVYNYNGEGRLFTVERTIVRYNAYDTETSKRIDLYGWVYAPNATE